MPHAPRTHRWPIQGERFFCVPSAEFFRNCETREQIYENFTAVG